MYRCRYLMSLGSLAILVLAAVVPAHGQSRTQKSPVGQPGMQGSCQHGGMQKMYGKGQGQTPFGQTVGMQTPIGKGGTPRPMQPMFGQGGGFQIPFQQGGGMMNPVGPQAGFQNPLQQGGGMMNPVGPQQAGFQNPLQQSGGLQYPLAQGTALQHPLMQYGSDNGQFDADQMQVLIRVISNQAAALQLQSPIATSGTQTASGRNSQLPSISRNR